MQTESLESASDSRTSADRLAAEPARTALVDAHVWLARLSACGAKREGRGRL